jgi:UDP-N-acetyl-D-glucosamine dehydrogenase
MTKLTEKIHRVVNIKLVNELKSICDIMWNDIWKVVNAVIKPFDFTQYDQGSEPGGTSNPSICSIFLGRPSSMDLISVPSN